MSWCRWRNGATVVLLLGLIGCALDGFSTRLQETSSDRAEPVVYGSVESVAEKTQAMLHGLGITATLQRDSSHVRLVCTTDKGKRFVLILTEESGPEGARTHLRLEWENGADDVLAVRVLAGFAGLDVR